MALNKCGELCDNLLNSISKQVDQFFNTLIYFTEFIKNLMVKKFDG